MKSKICLIFMLSFLFVLAGCGSKAKSEQAIKEDLLNSPNFRMCEGSVVTNFSIVNRITEDDIGEDTVYVLVDLENEKFMERQTYKMDYTRYNDGWKLDVVEPYQDYENPTMAKVKNNPDENTIIDLLITRSNSEIDDYQYEHHFGKANTYFFEDGKYTYTIEEANLDADNNLFDCKVTVNREFDLVDVTETDYLQLRFMTASDYEYWNWIIEKKEILSLSNKWKLKGAWSNSNIKKVIVFDKDYIVESDKFARIEASALSESAFLTGKNTGYNIVFWMENTSSQKIETSVECYDQFIRYTLSPDALTCENEKLVKLAD